MYQVDIYSARSAKFPPVWFATMNVSVNPELGTAQIVIKFLKDKPDPHVTTAIKQLVDSIKHSFAPELKHFGGRIADQFSDSNSFGLDNGNPRVITLNTFSAIASFLERIVYSNSFDFRAVPLSNIFNLWRMFSHPAPTAQESLHASISALRNTNFEAKRFAPK